MNHKIINVPEFYGILPQYRLYKNNIYIDSLMKNKIQEFNKDLHTEEEIAEFWIRIGYLIGNSSGNKRVSVGKLK